MAQLEAVKFSCSACGKLYTWKPELAGKVGKCKCGQSMKIPAEPPGSGGGGEIDLGLDAGALAALAKPSVRPGDVGCPSCGLSLPQGTIICISCGFNVKTGERLVTKSMGPDPTSTGVRPGMKKGGGEAGGNASSGNKRLGTKGGSSETWSGLIKAVAGVTFVMLIIGAKIYLKVNRATRNFGSDISMKDLKGDDAEALQLLADNDPIEGREFIEGHPQRSLGATMTNAQSKNMIERWYTEMKAKKVWCFNAMNSGAVVIELPDDAEDRKRFLVWAAARSGDRGDEPQWQDVGQKFLVLSTLF